LKFKKNLIWLYLEKKILFFDSPDGVNIVFVDGKRYNHHQYKLAQNREKRRLKNGRFFHSVEA